jgi:protein ImuB
MNRRIACVRIAWRRTGAPGGAESAALAGALLEAAPRVTPVAGHPCAYWADASGMGPRGGDAAVARALLAAARGAGLGPARVGVAGSCVAAALATRARGSAWRVVAPGLDTGFLARRSLDHLPMEPEMRDALGLLGLRRCGELAAFAAADVELRWGAPGVRAWRLARGDDDRWPFRPPPPDRAAAEAEWEPPVAGTEPLRFVLRGLIASVAEQIGRRQRVPALLRLTMRLEDAPDEVRLLRPARPTADARVLAGLCEQALDLIVVAGGLDAPVAGARLEALEEGAALADQLDIFRPPAPDPAAVHAALIPLLARWGDGALSRAVPQGAHLPALRAVWRAEGAAAVAELSRARTWGRAEGGAETPGVDPDAAPPTPRLRLVRAENDDPGRTDAAGNGTGASTPEGTEPAPEPVEPRPLRLCLRRLPEPRAVRVATDDTGQPVRLGAPGGTGAGAGRAAPELAVRAEGPERVSGGWWAGGYAREYWIAEDEAGCLRLLFRDARDGAWWAEGWWD